MVWTHSLDQFHEFLDILNNHHPSIKLKATLSETSVNFLDTTIFKNPLDKTQLHSKVYFKPTDTHALLHKKSFHPKSTFKGIVKSQILRFGKICSTKDDFNNACHTLFSSLQKRNYSKRFLRKIRSDTIEYFESGKRAGEQLELPGNSSFGHHKCDKCFTCSTCKYAPSCQNIISGYSDHVYPITGNLSCRSKNVIYLISCLCCNKQYVGQTERELHVRFLEHLNAISRMIRGRDQSNAVAQHLLDNHMGHFSRFNIPITITAIEQIADQGSKDANKAMRLNREQFWIDTLVTFAPHGMNEDAYSIRLHNSEKPILPFIVPFSKTGHDAAEIVKKHFEELQQNEKFDDVFIHRIVIAYQKHKNLKDLLVSTKS